MHLVGGIDASSLPPLSSSTGDVSRGSGGDSRRGQHRGIGEDEEVEEVDGICGDGDKM